MVSYVMMTIFAVMAAFYAEKKNSKLLLFFCVVLLVCYAGFRGETVGTDTPHYYRSYRLILQGAYYYSKDFLNERIIRTILNITQNPASVIFLYTAITHTLICSRLWEMRDKASFPLMIFIYLSSYYIKSMNVMRQYVAMALVFWASRYLSKKKTIVIFVLVVILASLIHGSAVSSLAMLVIYLGNTLEKKTLKRQVALVLSIIVINVGGAYAYNTIGYKYFHYFTETSFDFSPFTLYRLLTYLVIIYLTYKNQCSNIFSRSISNEPVALDKNNSISYFIGIAGISVGMFFPYMSRVGWFYVLHELPFYGQAYRATTKNRTLYRVLILAGMIYLYVMQLIVDGNNVFPYVTIWG